MQSRMIPKIICTAMVMAVLITTAFAATIYYPSSVTRSEDGTEIRKIYELSPEDDPAGIPRSDFEQGGFRYTLIEILKQEQPASEKRMETQSVSFESASKDMESVLALLPQEKEFTTDDGMTGILTLQLDTVKVEASGYGSSTKQISAQRQYPNLANQDTVNIPKTIEDNGRTLTLDGIQWQTDNTANVDGYAMGDRFTAVATYTGSKTVSYVKGYLVTADYVGEVSHIALNKVRYVAIYEGENLHPEETPVVERTEEIEPIESEGEIPVEVVPEVAQKSGFRWAYVVIPVGILALLGGSYWFAKRRGD